MDGQFPARSPLGELIDTFLISAAPLEKAGLLDAAAPRAEDVVGEDEFVLRLALFERVLEPLVLGIAERRQS